MKKLREISLYEVILCICVVMIHLLSSCLNGYTKGSFLSVLSFSVSRGITFSIPAFIMSSAIKMSAKFSVGKLRYFKFIWGRLKKIFLPYIIWSIIYYLYFVFRKQYFTFSIKAMFIYILNGEIAAPFYFIIVIMQFYLLMPLWLELLKKLKPVRAVFAASLITVASRYLTQDYVISNRLFTNYLMFWVIGFYIGSNYTRTVNFICSHKRSLIISAALFTAVYLISSYGQFTGKPGCWATEIIKLVFCTASSLALLYICIVTKKSKLTCFSPLTFYVYLIHCLIIFETDTIMVNCGIQSISTQFVIRFFVTYILSFAISNIYYKCKEKVLQKKR